MKVRIHNLKRQFRKRSKHTSIHLRARPILASVSLVLILSLFAGSAYLGVKYLQNADIKAKESQSSHASKKSLENTTKSINSTSPSPSARIQTEKTQGESSPTSQSPKKPKPSSGTYSPYPTPDVSPRYSVTNISSVHLSCYDYRFYYPDSPAELQLGLGNVSIYTIGPASKTFTWRVEANDGRVFGGDTNTIASGSTVWHNFPSTASYPQGLGSFKGFKDGAKVRFVITSPHYTATAWTNPVPSGSEQACHLGQLTNINL